MRKKTKFEKIFLALLVAPDVIGIVALTVSAIIYFLFN